mmetsp:Transcript_31463/g.90279  ORF Transcript_31463/g.90279 Transcript_31463/m.90279 type:complete len:88 (+) Transcript_31463:540-803(+)
MDRKDLMDLLKRCANIEAGECARIERAAEKDLRWGEGPVACSEFLDWLWAPGLVDAADQTILPPGPPGNLAAAADKASTEPPIKIDV